MKINELGSNKRKKQVDEGLGNWLLRKGALGTGRAALAQRDYLSSQAFKTELATFERAFNDAVAGEIIKLDPKVDDPVANGQIQPQQGQAQQGQAQQGQAQQGQAQQGQAQQGQAQQGQAQKTPAQIRAEKQAAATAAAQSQMAPYSKVSTTDPAGSPTGAQAFGSMADQLSKQSSQPRYQDYQRTGATGVGKKTVPMRAPAQVQKLASPMTDQQLRDIEAKRQRMKEATDFETAFAILMEDSVLMESQSAADYARQYIEAKTHEFQDQIPSNYQQALNQIYGEFAQEYDKTGKFPKVAATKLIKIVIALNQIVKRTSNSWGGSSYASKTGTAQAGGTQAGGTQAGGTTPADVVTNAINQLKTDSQSGKDPSKSFVNSILILAQGVHDSNPQQYSSFVAAVVSGLKKIGSEKPAEPEQPAQPTA